MKKCLAGLLVLMLLMGSALAEGMVPVNTPITIDGVRVAFFDAEGNYLQPMEKEGLVWVPLNALCENLGKTAQVQGQSIMVDGVRIGMFDDNGNFLMPEEVNGVVYVPLKAFCQSAGIDLVLEGNAYAIRRAAEAPAAQVAPAPAPTAEPEPEHPEYAVIKLDEKNFYKYFSIGITMSGFEEQKTKYFDEKLGYWFAVGAYFHLNATATTPYKYENVNFTAAANLNDTYASKDVTFSEVMPQSGELTKTATGTGGYFASYSHYNVKGNLLRGTKLKSASGKIYIPWEQAQSVLENSYQEAELKMSAADYAAAQRIFQDLAQNSYRDSKARAEEAGQKLAEQIAQKKRYDYAAAQAALESGDYAAAVKGFRALGNYEDSKAKLAEATEKKNAADYEKAAALEAEGDYEKAVVAFKALKDYSDSAQRAAVCREVINERAYQAAAALEEQGQFTQARSGFLAIPVGYKDSAARAQSLKKYDDMPEAQALLEAGSYTKAYELLVPYDGDAAVEELLCKARRMHYPCTYNREGVGIIETGELMTIEGRILPWAHGGSTSQRSFQDGLVIVQKEDLYYYADTQGQDPFNQLFKSARSFCQGKALVQKQDGSLCLIDLKGQQTSLPELKSGTYEEYVGEDLMSFKEGDKTGLVNLQGKVILKPKYNKGIGKFSNGMAIARNREGLKRVQTAVINPKGKEIIKLGKYLDLTLLGDDMMGIIDKSGKWVIANMKGKQIFKDIKEFDNVNRTGDFIYTVKNASEYKIYDLKGKMVCSGKGRPVFGGEGKVIWMESYDGKTKKYNRRIYHADASLKSVLSPLSNSTKMYMSIDSPYILRVTEKLVPELYKYDGLKNLERIW